jgi:hypothetical protein
MAKESNRTEILLEEIKSDMKLALEGHAVIRNSLQQMEGRLTEKIEENKSAIKFVAAKINNIEKKLDQHIQLPAHA